MVGGSLADDGGSLEAAALVEHWLLDDLVGSDKQRLRDRKPKCLRRLEVDYQLELGRLFDREVSGFHPVEDSLDVKRRTSVVVTRGRSIPDERADASKLRLRSNNWKAVLQSGA